MSNAKRKRLSQMNAGESSGDESQFNLEQDDNVNEDVINSFNEIGKGYTDPADASKASMFHQ